MIELTYSAGGKRGYSVGIIKSEAQRRVNRQQRARAVAASDMDAIRGPKLEVWSAWMPAYAYTLLCPDERYRRGSS